MHRPPWTVLVGDRRPEQRHHAVACVLVDRPLEPVHLCSDPPEAAIDELMHVLRVKLLGQGGEVGYVGEEHRDLAALPLEGAPGDQDLLGQVPRRVALDLRLLAAVNLHLLRAGWCTRRLRRHQRYPALAAEFKRWLDLSATVQAAKFRLRPTFDAEFHRRWIVKLTLRTPHASLLPGSRTVHGRRQWPG